MDSMVASRRRQVYLVVTQEPILFHFAPRRSTGGGTVRVRVSR